MTDRPTQPLTPLVNPENPEAAVAFWRRRTMPPMLTERWRSVTGPWGRFYAGMYVALVFVWRPTTWAAFAGLLAVTLIGSFGRRHWLWYAAPIAAVGIGTSSAEWMAAAAGLVIFGHRWATRASRPDALAMRLHLRIAELTGSPTRERYWRLETFAEARDRLLTFQRGAKMVARPASPFKRIRKEEYRPLNPVPHWLRIDYTPPREVADGAYEVAGLYVHYPASCPDDDPAWQDRLLQAIAAKLPPMTIGEDRVTVVPGLVGEWHTDQDEVYVTVARPIPAWATLDDMPTFPGKAVAALGLTSPDAPIRVMTDDGRAVAVWNRFEVDFHGIPPEPNAIVIGPPGSYKTTLVRAMIHGCRENTDDIVRAIDGKREGAFAYLANQTNCQETADPALAKGFILWAHAEMLARYAENDRRKRAGDPEVIWRPILLPIDEGMSWLDQLANDPDYTDFIFKLVDLSRLGRGARISIIWSTQRPDVQGVAGKGTVGQMRDSLGCKLGGAGLTDTGARMIYGDSNGQLANRIPKVPRGRFGLMIGGTFQLIQHAWNREPFTPTDPDAPVEYKDLASQPPPSNDGGTEELPDVPSLTARRGRTLTP